MPSAKYWFVIQRFCMGIHGLQSEAALRDRSLRAKPKCPICNARVLEDEMHFIAECGTYRLARLRFAKLFEHGLFMRRIFDPALARHLAGFIKDCFGLRERKLAQVAVMRQRGRKPHFLHPDTDDDDGDDDDGYW